ncbi:hypothetical protein EV44_g2314 [Erysiphe necator]|uniref:Uncharacterized protein n=1 Tax=Uncinula necator TaxID=52586 RepID=A0A0B1NUS1_UNCNE|nr:hypothetical protein EV44_g2314 [Erysiphe necator]
MTLGFVLEAICPIKPRPAIKMETNISFGHICAKKKKKKKKKKGLLGLSSVAVAVAVAAVAAAAAAASNK